MSEQQSPLFPQPIPIIGCTGEFASGKTLFGLTIDPKRTLVYDLEKSSESYLSPGWFRAAVSDVYEKDDNLKLQFALRDGRKHTETLWNPGSSDKPERLRQRRSAFAIRLGLVPREAKGTAYEFDWLDAIGKEVIIHLVESKPNDKGQKFIQLDWMGIFAIDDTRGLENLPKDSANPSTEPAKAAAAASPPNLLRLDGTAVGSITVWTTCPPPLRSRWAAAFVAVSAATAVAELQTLFSRYYGMDRPISTSHDWKRLDISDRSRDSKFIGRVDPRAVEKIIDIAETVEAIPVPRQPRRSNGTIRRMWDFLRPHGWDAASRDHLFACLFCGEVLPFVPHATMHADGDTAADDDFADIVALSG